MSSARGSISSPSSPTRSAGKSIRDLIQARVDAMTRYSPTSSRSRSSSRISFKYSRYCSPIRAIGISVISTSLIRIRWRSRSSGPSKTGRRTEYGANVAQRPSEAASDSGTEAVTLAPREAACWRMGRPYARLCAISRCRGQASSSPLLALAAGFGFDVPRRRAISRANAIASTLDPSTRRRDKRPEPG